MREHAVGTVAMEVSSHALDQHRVDGTRFAAVTIASHSASLTPAGAGVSPPADPVVSTAASVVPVAPSVAPVAAVVSGAAPVVVTAAAAADVDAP